MHDHFVFIMKKNHLNPLICVRRMDWQRMDWQAVELNDNNTHWQLRVKMDLKMFAKRPFWLASMAAMIRLADSTG